MVRGVRGATVVAEDRPDLIRAATHQLLEAIVAANGLDPGDIASVIFTTTPDLTSEYPARAARALGWSDVPLLGASEMGVLDGLPRCIRVLVHINTDRTAADIKHVYLGAARTLRPDR